MSNATASNLSTISSTNITDNASNHIATIPTTCVCIMMVMGVVGNSSILYVFGSLLSKSTPHTLITILSTLDLSLAGCALPLEIIEISNIDRDTVWVMCFFLKLIKFFCFMSSNMTMTIIAIDRHRRITKPFAK